MRCDEFESRLQTVLDERGQAELAPALALHAEQCTDCATLLSGYEVLWEGLAALPLPEPRADLAVRVLGELRVVRPARRYSWRLSGAVLAVAAALLVAVLPLVRPGNDTVQVMPATTAESQPLVAQRSTAPTGYTLPINLRQQPMADVAKETGQSLAVAVLALPGVRSGSPESRPEWMLQVTDGLQPVTHSMAGALNVLLRAIPSVDSTRPDPSAS
jgi:hypothetical protein